MKCHGADLLALQKAGARLKSSRVDEAMIFCRRWVTANPEERYGSRNWVLMAVRAFVQGDEAVDEHLHEA
jgi:hypothetical protein